MYRLEVDTVDVYRADAFVGTVQQWHGEQWRARWFSPDADDSSVDLIAPSMERGIDLVRLLDVVGRQRGDLDATIAALTALREEG